VARAIVGKSVADAKMELRFMVKRASSPMEKLLDSAVANATNSGMNRDTLMVKEFRVDKGIVAHRSMPRAFGRASRINKRSSHVTIVLAEKVAKVSKAKKAVKAKAKTK
jgi:large subunit ribosomal protein L22